MPASKYKKETIELGGEKIQIKKGALRAMLGVPEGKDISMSLINRILKLEIGDTFRNPYKNKDQKVTRLLKSRVSLAKTLIKRNKK